MKINFSQARVLTFLAILLFSTACNGPGKNNLPKETEHPKLIKNTGNGNVQCSMQDKAGIIWFGTSDNGLYKYDGKSFGQFLVTNGLNSNNISCILEDNDGKIWIGTDAGLCRYDGKTFAKIEINPVGLAGGFDKDAECVDLWDMFGFGFVELGTVTPKPQPGNPKPRLFRYPEMKALINRMGFNNDGAEAIAARLRRNKEKGHVYPGVTGISIGKQFSTLVEDIDHSTMP